MQHPPLTKIRAAETAVRAKRRSAAQFAGHGVSRQAHRYAAGASHPACALRDSERPAVTPRPQCRIHEAWGVSPTSSARQRLLLCVGQSQEQESRRRTRLGDNAEVRLVPVATPLRPACRSSVVSRRPPWLRRGAFAIISGRRFADGRSCTNAPSPPAKAGIQMATSGEPPQGLRQNAPGGLCAGTVRDALGVGFGRGDRR